MTFFGLYSKNHPDSISRIESLKAACMRHSVKANFIEVNELDFNSLPKLKSTDLLYTINDGTSVVENYFLRNKPTNFYKNSPLFSQAFLTIEYSLLLKQQDILQPKIIPSITNDRAILKKHVDYLGGFPIIIKSTRSSRGIGTIKCDSWHNLISTIDYLKSINAQFIMREFIHAKSGCRLMVLGNSVTAAADFDFNTNDFRNAAQLDEINYKEKKYSEDLKDTAIQATSLCNLEFAGIDFLEDHKGSYYLLELNYPTGFTRLEQKLNISIAGEMIAHLKNKSLKKNEFSTLHPNTLET